ncbi:hypothetical protein CDAR_75241 [Caerostris darwini]|uniref:Uncharacterized protein n=1 Tax=Caerostris darwini TaxID=1538125 RepID=A0AAV4WH11_9ARAC|nr:hypothetical protein CDAR_75241 [Caerostris darwini]
MSLIYNSEISFEKFADSLLKIVWRCLRKGCTFRAKKLDPEKQLQHETGAMDWQESGKREAVEKRADDSVARCQPLVTKSWIKTKTDLAGSWQFHSDIQEENRIEKKKKKMEGKIPGPFNFFFFPVFPKTSIVRWLCTSFSRKTFPD